jgi:signal transduction histidine kinase
VRIIAGMASLSQGIAESIWRVGEIQLTVSNSGLGFDNEAAKASRGLGLISMAERLKMLNGT